MNVNAKVVLEALKFYEEKGYKLVEVPYIVENKFSLATSPDNKVDFKHLDKGVYVASAEQGFLQMIHEGLSEGSYVAITPCYRDEEIISDTHLNIFLKVELINLGSSDFLSLKEDAEHFFNKMGVEVLEEVVDINQVDLVSSRTGVELGSYGTRSYNGVTYSYGTGVAEPRFNRELKENL